MRALLIGLLSLASLNANAIYRCSEAALDAVKAQVEAELKTRDISVATTVSIASYDGRDSKVLVSIGDLGVTSYAIVADYPEDSTVCEVQSVKASTFKVNKSLSDILK